MNEFFNAYSSSVKRYDSLVDEAGSHICEAGFIYTAFISEILKTAGTAISLPKLMIPVYDSSEYRTARAVGIYIDEERQFPRILFDDDTDIPFSELNISAQDCVVQNIFMEIKTADFRRALFPENGVK
jgi:hypothetical protein